MSRMREFRKECQQVSSPHPPFLSDFIFSNPNKGEQPALSFPLQSVTCREFFLWSQSDLSRLPLEPWSHILHTLIYRDSLTVLQLVSSKTGALMQTLCLLVLPVGGGGLAIPEAALEPLPAACTLGRVKLRGNARHHPRSAGGSLVLSGAA